jgi:hypothetical protein
VAAVEQSGLAFPGELIVTGDGRDKHTGGDGREGVVVGVGGGDSS